MQRGNWMSNMGEKDIQDAHIYTTNISMSAHKHICMYQPKFPLQLLKCSSSSKWGFRWWKHDMFLLTFKGTNKHFYLIMKRNQRSINDRKRSDTLYHPNHSPQLSNSLVRQTVKNTEFRLGAGVRILLLNNMQRTRMKIKFLVEEELIIHPHLLINYKCTFKHKQPKNTREGRRASKPETMERSFMAGTNARAASPFCLPCLRPSVVEGHC